MMEKIFHLQNNFVQKKYQNQVLLMIWFIQIKYYIKKVKDQITVSLLNMFHSLKILKGLWMNIFLEFSLADITRFLCVRLFMMIIITIIIISISIILSIIIIIIIIIIIRIVILIIII